MRERKPFVPVFIGGAMLASLVAAGGMCGGALFFTAQHEASQTRETAGGIEVVGDLPVGILLEDIDLAAQFTAEASPFDLSPTTTLSAVRETQVRTYPEGVPGIGSVKHGGLAFYDHVRVSAHSARLFIPYLVHEWLHVLWYRAHGGWQGMHEDEDARILEDQILVASGFVP